ncbi:nuclear transport factor 2 family protein [Allostreptomyces psammosilenae]|uniref:Actinorhodin biosynthesis protein ActVIA n=1 Tax=Allostreptomyces psammosilenae TaxID=1892865 RepID=A0A852ZP69_9ACTN|nr:nuclear transport factor 2 family protein [Allostreptomyces psammosilenae]NYI04193.1 actinorhodin biosynthesis protein ActVIA [Allostreptomyces psammosilenae]
MTGPTTSPTTQLTIDPAATPGDFAELYAEVQQFYAVQMSHVDEGRYDEYAATFTEDGELSYNPAVPPVRTPAAIAAELHAFHGRFAADPGQRRHWFTMLRLDPRDDGSVHASCYSLIVTSRPGQAPVCAPSGEVRDVLVRVDGRLLVRSRTVEHDRPR